MRNDLEHNGRYVIDGRGLRVLGIYGFDPTESLLRHESSEYVGVYQETT